MEYIDASEQMKWFVEQIERLEDDRSVLGTEIRNLLAEAKNAGFDTKIMRQVVKLRKMDSNDRQEQEELLDLYKRAIGLEI